MEGARATLASSPFSVSTRHPTNITRSLGFLRKQEETAEIFQLVTGDGEGVDLEA